MLNYRGCYWRIVQFAVMLQTLNQGHVLHCGCSCFVLMVFGLCRIYVYCMQSMCLVYQGNAIQILLLLTSLTCFIHNRHTCGDIFVLIFCSTDSWTKHFNTLAKSCILKFNALIFQQPVQLHIQMSTAVKSVECMQSPIIKYMNWKPRKMS